MSNDRIETLGERVRAARRDQGMTQEQLAGVCGVGIRFIRELENGKDTCQIGRVFFVLSMLGLEVVIDGKTL